MDMSAAALPAISGRSNEADKVHPLYNEWRKSETSCTRLMINGQNFKDWLFQREANENREIWSQHEQYRPFMAWMRANQGGARGNLCFPENFKAWLNGVRW